MVTCGRKERRAPSLLLAIVLCCTLVTGMVAAARGPGAPNPDGTVAHSLSPAAAANGELVPDSAARTSMLTPRRGARDGSQRPAAPGFVLSVQQAGSISGFVLNNTNSPIPNVTVELRDAAQNLLATTQTDATGAYSFGSVVAGATYVVRVAPPPGFTVRQVLPGPLATASGTSGILITNFNPAATYENNNFVLASSAVVTPSSGTISGSVFRDVNGNGVIDSADVPIPGVQVLLQGPSGPLTATTDVSGAYAFSGLAAGTYQISQVVPTNFAAVAAFPAPGGVALSATTIQVTIAGGVSGSNNFLDRSTVVSATVGTISGSVINEATGLGIPGVPIRLFTQLPTFVGETRTDANGAYAFTDQPTGSYLVVQLVPGGLSPVAAVPGINGANIPGNTRELAVTVMADVNSAHNNFLDASTTLPATGTISGSVFRDVNGNGMIDALDEPIFGVRVLLQPLSGAPQQTFFTGLNGAYVFSGLAPGTYNVVQVVPANFAPIAAFAGPVGAVVVNATTIQVTVTGNVSGNNNFLDRSTVVSPTVGIISGSVIQDVNRDGFIDFGDVPIVGVTIQLFIQGGLSPIKQTSTDVNGAYAFTDVPPGFYQVLQLVPNGLVSEGSNPLAVTAVAGVNQGNNNFLDAAPVPTTGTISGTVLVDLNGNNMIDTSDAQLPGVLVELLNQSGTVVLKQFVTDVHGAYAFSGLAAGTYQVVQSVPANYAPILAVAGPGGVALSSTRIQVTLSGGVSGNNNFLDRSTVVSPTVGTISGSVFQDVDNDNGFIDALDAPLAGVTIQLFVQGGVSPVRQTSTDVNGAYAFTDVPPGFYQVLQLVPNGLVSEGPNPLAVTAVAGVNQGNNNFLDRAAQLSSTISGSVILDVDHNGVVDVGPGADVPIPGVEVLLQPLSGAPQQAFFTDVNGAWAFSGLAPGTYNVVQVVPANFAPIAAFAGPVGAVVVNATTIQVTVTGNISGNNNFLDVATVVSPTVGTISGSVFQDVDNDNGFIDALDAPLAGVTIQLFVQGGVSPVRQTSTDVNGAYAFTDVPPGFYQVLQLVPTGLVSEGPNPLAVTAVAGVNQGNNNFLDGTQGLPTGANTISGFAIEDLNLNGIPDNEPGLAGMVIVLRNGFGTAVGSVTTDSTGAFSFSGLAGGNYTLTAMPPGGRTSTNAIAGVGGLRLSANSILVRTTAGITDYSSQLFLAGP